MNLIQRIGLLSVLLCAAMLMVSGAAAAGPGGGPGQGNSLGQGGFTQRMAQGGPANQDAGSGQGNLMPANGQNANQGTNDNGQSGHQGPPGGTFGNMTGQMAMNMTPIGNMTWYGPDNSTADAMAFDHPPFDGNTTDENNWTAQGAATMGWPGGGNVTGPGGNLTAPEPVNGNMTHSWHHLDNSTANESQNQNGNNDRAGLQQESSANQAQDQKDSDLIAAFLKWFRSQTGSSS